MADGAGAALADGHLRHAQAGHRSGARYCLSGGTDVALLCDIIIAADDATIGFPPARAMGSLPKQMWVYHCGPQWAKRLFLTGDTITGVEAAQIGLVLKLSLIHISEPTRLLSI